jgi:hypothetical protein
MTRILPIFVALCLFVIVVPSKAAPMTAGRLSRGCSNGEGGFESGLCVGFIMAWSEQLSITPIPANNGKTIHFYFEDNVNVGQVMRVFQKYVKEHPEEENKPALNVLLDACVEAKIINVRDA